MQGLWEQESKGGSSGCMGTEGSSLQQVSRILFRVAPFSEGKKSEGVSITVAESRGAFWSTSGGCGELTGDRIARDSDIGDRYLSVTQDAEGRHSGLRQVSQRAEQRTFL